MLKLGVIQSSPAPYYSHPKLINKLDSSWTFCIDYRQLNYSSRFLRWPTPNIVTITLYSLTFFALAKNA